jgi:hypothetical protein
MVRRYRQPCGTNLGTDMFATGTRQTIATLVRQCSRHLGPMCQLFVAMYQGSLDSVDAEHTLNALSLIQGDI